MTVSVGTAYGKGASGRCRRIFAPMQQPAALLWVPPDAPTRLRAHADMRGSADFVAGTLLVATCGSSLARRSFLVANACCSGTGTGAYDVLDLAAATPPTVIMQVLSFQFFSSECAAAVHMHIAGSPLLPSVAGTITLLPMIGFYDEQAVAASAVAHCKQDAPDAFRCLECRERVFSSMAEFALHLVPPRFAAAVDTGAVLSAGTAAI